MAASLGNYRDILDKKGFAHLATVGTDGRPQVTPVWVDFDGAHVRVNTARGRVKDRNLTSNPRVALSVQDPDNPYRYVQIRGRVVEMTEQGADTTSTVWPGSTSARTAIRTARTARSACSSRSRPSTCRA